MAWDFVAQAETEEEMLKKAAEQGDHSTEYERNYRRGPRASACSHSLTNNEAGNT
jgi:hypothetical protein